jgi:hypothetical protein
MIIYPDGTLHWESAVQSSDSHDTWETRFDFFDAGQNHVFTSPSQDHGESWYYFGILFLTPRRISSMIGVTTRIYLLKSIRLSSTTGANRYKEHRSVPKQIVGGGRRERVSH